MGQREADQLAEATQHMSLPDGGSLAFWPVGFLTGFNLPEAIRRSAPRRRASFVAGRMAAQAALRKAGFAGDPGLGIDADGLPVWPRGWRGSISHTDDVAAAVVAPMTPAGLLGLDVERIVTAETAAEVAAEIAPELPLRAELRLRQQDVTRAFSAKEALYKALYPATLRFREFSAAHVTLSDAGPDRTAHATLVLTEDWAPHWPAGTSFRVAQRIAAGHVATILGL